MNKTKKLLSLFTAAALSVSAFAGLAVTASAENPLTKIDDDYTTMSATDLQAEVAKYTAVWGDLADSTDAGKNVSVEAVEKSGIQFKSSLIGKYHVYADRTLETEYDGKDILIAGKWYTGNSTIYTPNYVYLAFLDSSGNEIVKLNGSRAIKEYGYSIGGGSFVKVGTLDDNTPSIDIEFSFIFDPVENKVKSGSVNGTAITETSVTAGDLKTIRFGRDSSNSSDTSHRGNSDAIIKSLNIQEAPVATTISVEGDDAVTKGGSTTYDIVVKDQYGETMDVDTTLELREAADGISVEGKTVSADENTETTNFTLVGKYGSLSIEKSISVMADSVYELTTTPYSLVAIDSDAGISSGRTGILSLPLKYCDGQEHDVKITKTGYNEYSDKLTLSTNDNSTHMLTLAEGNYYYEDFANVDDDFGSNNTNALKVSDGVLTYASNEAAAITLPVDGGVVVTDKLVSVQIAATAAKNKTADVVFTGTDFKSTYNTSNNRTWRVSAQRTYSPSVNHGEYHLLSIVIPSANGTGEGYVNGQARMYLDGRYIGLEGAKYPPKSLTGLNFTSQDTSNKFQIKSIQITDKPKDFALAADDIDTKDGDNTNTNITSVTYLTGYTASLTLPDPVGKDGYTFLGWTADDGATLKAAGETVTATAAATYTAVYAQSATGVILDAVTGTGENELTDTDVLEGDVNKLATPVYVTITPAKAYSKPQIVWELTYYTDSEVGQTKRTKDVTYDTALASGVETKLGAVFTGINLKKYNTHETSEPSLKAILTEGE